VHAADANTDAKRMTSHHRADGKRPRGFREGPFYIPRGIGWERVNQGKPAHRNIPCNESRLMDNFPRNFRDNLRVSRGALFLAAVVVAALLVGLMAAYSAFDLGSILPKRRP